MLNQTFFSNAQDFNILGGSFNNVLGNQHNHYHQITRRGRKKRTEFDDVDGGGVKGCQCEDCEWRQRVIKTICTAKLSGVEGEFTVVSYSGREGRKVSLARYPSQSKAKYCSHHQAFEEEFRTLSRQLYAHSSTEDTYAEGSLGSRKLPRFMQSTTVQFHQWSFGMVGEWMLMAVPQFN
ncbi:hypothetical protein PM082_014856 [Marasmius tenuissimus]|nr:hypothetical protein PM082_014856 [Marasmius tenuissimus]